MSKNRDVKQLIANKKVLAIMGATATGKSGLSMLLAEEIPIEIISVDSALIYQGMDIGTAKPSAEELARVPHHLINIMIPSETYSASSFVEDVHKIVKEIFGRGNLPVLVGGTMMYFHALQQGMASLPSADAAIRSLLLQQWQNDPQVLHQRLKAVDEVAATRIHYNDQQRVCRALEVFELTGKPLSQHQKEGREQQSKALTEFELIKIALLPADRKVLHAKIEQRFKQMLSQGFMAEVEQLYLQPELHPDLPSIRSVGYRQAWLFLQQEYDYDTFIEKALVATRQLAKRQITWLRKEQDVLLLDPFKLSTEKLLQLTLDVIFPRNS